MKIVSRSNVVSLTAVVVISLIGFIAYFQFIHENRDTSRLPDDIVEQFGCDRISFEERETDVYCDQPELYYEHLDSNNLITEWGDPRYQEWLDNLGE